MTTLPTHPDELLGLMRSIVERMLDPDSEHIDLDDAVRLAEAIHSLDVALVSEASALPLPWRIRNAKEVQTFLKAHKGEHTDTRTGELDCTHLAEAAAAALDLYVQTPDVDIPEVLFELTASFDDESK